MTNKKKFEVKTQNKSVLPPGEWKAREVFKFSNDIHIKKLKKKNSFNFIKFLLIIAFLAIK